MSQISSSPFWCARTASGLSAAAIAGAGRERYRFELELARFDLREVENVVQDGQECLGRRTHRGEAVPLVGGELGVEHEVRHADDAVHRRPDLVAHVRQKRALRAAGIHGPVAGDHQFFVARLELGGARVHRAFQIVLLPEQLLIALLDVAEHRVELIDQLADFVVVSRVGPDVVVAAVAHQARHLDQPHDGTEDQPRGRA